MKTASLIVILFMNELDDDHYVVAGVRCALCMPRDGWCKGAFRAAKCSIQHQRFRVNHICFSYSISSMRHGGGQWDDFTRQQLLSEGQGLREVWRRKDNKRLTRSCLVFFPAVGHSSQPICADRKWRAPMCRLYWRQLGLKNQCSRNQYPHLPPHFFHLSFPSFTFTWSESETIW